MDRRGLGDRKNACFKSPVLFISPYAGKRKIPVGLYSQSIVLIVSFTIASKIIKLTKVTNQRIY